MTDPELLKDELLELIKKSDDALLLNTVFQMMTSNYSSEGISLSKSEVRETAESYAQSLKDENLIDFESFLSRRK